MQQCIFEETNGIRTTRILKSVFGGIVHPYAIYKPEEYTQKYRRLRVYFEGEYVVVVDRRIT